MLRAGGKATLNRCAVPVQTRHVLLVYALMHDGSLIATRASAALDLYQMACSSPWPWGPVSAYFPKRQW